MIHATISHHGRLHCVIEFSYNEQAKNAIKALPGTSYDGKRWLVAVMHLPTLKTVFTTLTVAPEVVAAYHALLKQMLCDFLGHEGSKAAKELLTKHFNGIAAIEATGWQPTKQIRRRNVQPQSMFGPVEAKDAGLSLWLTGVKNAHAAQETKAHIVKAGRGKAKA